VSEFTSLFRSGTQCPPPRYFAGDWFAKLRCGRVPGPARTVDIAPTLTGRLGIATPSGLDGLPLFD